MIESHEIVTMNKSVKRGGAFQSTASGKMVPIGSRIPQGGAAEDAYTPYAHMASDTIEAINAMMSHGRVRVEIF